MYTNVHFVVLSADLFVNLAAVDSFCTSVHSCVLCVLC